MHIYVNASVGDMRGGYIELDCKSKVLLGGRFIPAEISAWDKRVQMYVQNNIWMDRRVMALSAKKFNNHIKERLSPKAKYLLVADNLDAHVFDGTQDILSKDGRVVVLFLPPNYTEIVQPIDAGHGRSIRCSIGRQFDARLMKAYHLNIWEKGITSAYVLICNFVAEANEEEMAKDESRVSCFRQCGVLLTLDGTGDELIKPQGCTKLPIIVPDLVDLNCCEICYATNEAVLPEALEFGTTDEEAAILIGDEEEEIGDDALVVHEEDSKNEEISEPSQLLAVVDDLESITDNGKRDEEDVITGDSDENELIQESSRGRRISRKIRFYCEGY